MADGEDAAVDRMQPPAREAMGDLAASKTQRDELTARHDPVLTRRERRDELVVGSRLIFCTYGMPKISLDSHAAILAAHA